MMKPIKVLITKPGLDGHDRGAKVVAHYLRECGMEVIYTGLHKSSEDIVAQAREHKPDVIGLSIMSGAYLPLAEKLMAKLKEENLAHTPVIVGGVIRSEDIPALKSLGVAGVFPSGSRLADIEKLIANICHRDS
ncbi:MAG: cobalamin-dependent protein [Thermodesulfobacteriota bacterium]